MPPFVVPPPKMRPWTQTRAETVGSYRILDVVRVDLEDASGRPRGDAYTLRSRNWCNVLALTPDGHAVFVWQYRFGTGALALEIPGGVIDDGETPEVAARRELLEETGYEAERIEPLVVLEPNPAIQSNLSYTFLAHGARPTGATQFDPMEELETVLVPVARLADLLDGGQVGHALVRGPIEVFLRKYGATLGGR